MNNLKIVVGCILPRISLQLAYPPSLAMNYGSLDGLWAIGH